MDGRSNNDLPSTPYRSEITTTLITGANRGLGFEAARQLGAAGHRVWIGARDETRGRQAADTIGARFVQLDVTDDASVTAAAETVEELDVLVNNAGISGGRIGAGDATAEDMRMVYETNGFGVLRVLRAFIPLLEKSAAPVIVNVSSGVGSLNLAADPGGTWREADFPVYASSKAAINMLTIKYAAAFPTMRINSVDPGFTATDFNQHRGTQTVEEGRRGDRPLRADPPRRANRRLLRPGRHRTLVTLEPTPRPSTYSRWQRRWQTSRPSRALSRSFFSRHTPDAAKERSTS
jgi:NAD(P)-dependent dehydrogenase (short-subunit alcohol dehydrogenase family)